MNDAGNISRRTALGGLIAAMASSAPLKAADTARLTRQSRRVITYMPNGAGVPVAVELLLRGKGPLVVLLPSLGRGARDFDDLASRIAAAGYRTAAVNPRGIGQSRGPEPHSLADYASDVFEAIRVLQSQHGRGPAMPVVLIGHAYGNRLARAVAARYPEAVSSLILLASGGQVTMAPTVARALTDVFDTTLSPEAHIAAVRIAFFAPGNDPEVWRDGWYGAVAMQQIRAVRNSPADTWVAGGDRPIFIIQAAQDVVAPPANAEALRAAHPDRVAVAVLENAGHAMLPEQPDKLAQLVLGRLAAGRKAIG
ncbi:MAG: alpha/beta fold hydrolase [Sphingomonadales bacterium]|nr:alpha/beta fold hydrolase [Sphingomonadales bacterium]MDE2567719.1 alpha/beta fold hydrolase [Sphingomonadales bacterium]